MIVIRPVVNMRKGASENSEVVSQAIFAEIVTRTQESGDWSLITTPDGYSGWVKSSSLVSHSGNYETSVKISLPVAHLYAQKESIFGPLLTLPFGVKLKVMDESDPDWICVQLPFNECCFVRKGTVVPYRSISREEMIRLSFDFLGSPYTWGGRSSFGFDCSGFIQMLYGQMGIELKRDSHLQSKDPRFHEVLIENLQMGDLIFWGFGEDQIRHVGLYIGQGQFIHTSSREHMPYLRISNLRDPTWDASSASVYPYRVFKALN